MAGICRDLAAVGLAAGVEVRDDLPVADSAIAEDQDCEPDARRLMVGADFPPRQLRTVSGDSVAIPDTDRIVHLQLRRFAGCPICNLHLRSMANRHEEIAAAGIREIVVFHSTVEELRRYQVDVPFTLVADPKRALYVELGVEPSPRALLNPRAWWSMLRGPLHSLRAMLTRSGPPPPLHPTGGRLGLPADLLIAGDGAVLACKYGTHAYDQWSVDELLALADAIQIAGC